METASRRADWNRTVAGWALYDFANTMFSMNIVSRYFPLWVTGEHGAPDIYFSVSLSLSMFLVAITSPALGAISDDTGQRVKPLFYLTAGCVLATALIGFSPTLMAGLVLFALANYCYQSALVFYDGLLPDVTGSGSIAKVSGYGVALGYVGAIAGLGLIAPVESAFGPNAVYFPTAVLFMLSAVPCFLWVKDKNPAPFARADIAGAFKTLLTSFKMVKERRDLFLFLAANFLILDGVNTVIAFMSIYANTVIGLSGGRLNVFLITSTVGAAVGSFIWGTITHKAGARRAMIYVCWMWLATLVLAAFSTGETIFWAVGPMAGVALGGVWVAGRVMLVNLAPSSAIGECFGLYSVAGKAASITGPLVWGVVVYVFSFLGGTIQHRLAVLSLAIFIGGGLWLIRKITPTG
ncbi:MAG: MFS transporter [Nitrospinae bacterium]|nr:MFS transporter [Nitrospinota bacterium]